MSTMGPKILKAIKEAIAELCAMDRDKLRFEIQNRAIGGFGAMLLETGALETGPLHVGVEIQSWDDPFGSATPDSSWTCVEVVNRGSSDPLGSGNFDFGAYTLSLPPHIEDRRASQADFDGADDYPYSVAA